MTRSFASLKICSLKRTRLPNSQRLLVAVIRTYFDRIARINPSLPLVKRLHAILNREVSDASTVSA